MTLSEVLEPYTVTKAAHAVPDQELHRRLANACDLPHVRVDDPRGPHWPAVCRNCHTPMVVFVRYF